MAQLYAIDSQSRQREAMHRKNKGQVASRPDTLFASLAVLTLSATTRAAPLYPAFAKRECER